MKKLLFKIQAFRRKNDIDAIKCEKQGLQDLLFTALSERGSLNRVQRTQVLAGVVEQWKAQEQANESEKRKAYLEAEESNDVAKGIALFNFSEIIKL